VAANLQSNRGKKPASASNTPKAGRNIDIELSEAISKVN
jgi:hypothetical protein